MDNHENQVVHPFTSISPIFRKEWAYADSGSVGDGW
jgi:hypothetical protein